MTRCARGHESEQRLRGEEIGLAIPSRLRVGVCRSGQNNGGIEDMNKIFRSTIIGAAVIAGLTLSGCSANPNSEQESFEFTGDTLNVVHNNSYMNVSVTSHSSDDEVIVEVSTQTMGQDAETPAWSLSDGILNLGSPCGGNIVGYCEGSYAIQVPEGTAVLVNGSPVSVG